MDTDADRSNLHTANRFGQLSKNMFFARHVPQPKYLKFITGTAGVRVCHVRDDLPHLSTYATGDLAKSLLSDPRFTIEFPPNTYNEALLRSYAERIHPRQRRERFLPPLRGWDESSAGIAERERWRRELSRMAETVGLVTADELSEIEHKKEPPPSSPSKRSQLKTANGEYSQRTGRWNETPRAVSRSRSLCGRTPLSAIVPDHLFCVDENEREMWMLQVLCQILKTQDLNEVRSWLVSTSPNEKEAVRQLIASAIRGLEESGRIQPTAYFTENTRSFQSDKDTLDSLMSNKFPNVSSNESLPSNSEDATRPGSRPRTSSKMQSASTTTSMTTDIQSKSTRGFQNNLDRIDEEKILKPNPPESTKVDGKRDIQVLTINDDGNNKQSSANKLSEEIPF